MLRYLTSGESHGKALVAIVEGFPAGFEISEEYINKQLKKRQGGHGRGGRMAIETDKVQIIAGVRDGKSMGSPITLMIENKDWENWQNIMQAAKGAHIEERKVTKPRPGHADLTGTIKYNHKDVRNVLERASARETAIRVAVGALAECILQHFEIDVFGHVVKIATVDAKVNYENLNEELYNTPLYCTDEVATGEMIKIIDEAKNNGDSLGGIVEVVAKNVPKGLGSYVHWDRKLDARLAYAVMSIQAIKAVELGAGFNSANLSGSELHDEIYFSGEKGFYHETNNSGGIEGGMSNGEPIILRAAMKPIPTLYKPLKSVDYFTKEQYEASVERSDSCAVSAAAIVAQSVVSLEIANSFLEKFAGDNLQEIEGNYENYVNYLAEINEVSR
ncbi:chorismate synthase [Desulfonispora thiosulfatigenes DSM 11270]|uniref:Chorismate synthase n=1 Tax=Desulfonispora thiosulfatigenes DSM 11270 TaxID=656914 RepID=A0A1W1V795_DESTI|nr:chorismate synthase [Desulfonispora thiosulfatigenes]SMB89238.1 chorismate synthase [Desulfonispora thiosulfatigenes DSM 11270]